RLDSFTAKTPKGERFFTNLTAELRGDASKPWVVVVSHYDTKPGTSCPGANDGASTTGLLVGLVRVLRGRVPSGGNVLLVWTDGEECMDSYGPDDGLWGSRHAAQSLKEKGVEVKGVVCVDMLGDRDLNISIPRNCDKSLADLALRAAAATGHAGKVGRCDLLVKDDHVPFLERGFKAIDLIDFDYGSAPGLNDYWHTAHDTADKLSEDSLRVSGEIVLKMIELLLEP
ncbi:MAG: M28 family peptidase, partial [Kiritimatiellae bacterium]|nr:M28 family peptidase [Kiritimatiellia bacterium]